MVRRLPVYVLADCSESMAGEAIEALKIGVASLQQNLLSDPMALESAYLSVITFHDTAQQIVPLTEILEFELPDLDAGGLTALGAALALLKQCIQREVRRTSAGVKGDWRPLVFLLTDGDPSDDWQDAARELRELNLGSVVALACGSEANVSVLETLTDTVYLMREMNAHSFTQFFRWISSTVTLAAEGRLIESPRGGVLAAPPPSELVAV